MKSLMIWGLSLGLACLMAADVSAQDETKKSKKKAGQAPAAQIFNLPKEVELTDEQKEKMEALKKEYSPKLVELSKKVDAIYTPEQMTARREAMAKAKAENLKNKERQALLAAIEVTPEQKTKLADAEAELKALRTTVLSKIAEVLTDEQEAKVPALAPKKKGKKNA